MVEMARRERVSYCDMKARTKIEGERKDRRRHTDLRNSKNKKQRRRRATA